MPTSEQREHHYAGYEVGSGGAMCACGNPKCTDMTKGDSTMDPHENCYILPDGSCSSDRECIHSSSRGRAQNTVQFQRKPIPERGGYVCDINGVIDTNTIATIREVSYQHEEAMNVLASLIRSHEALRAQLAAAERERDFQTEARWDANRDLVRVTRERDALIVRAKAGDDYLAHTAQERDELRARAEEFENASLAYHKSSVEWQRRAERAEFVIEAADAFVSYQGTDVEPQAWDTLNAALAAYRTTHDGQGAG